jgi:hypothetical protein
MNQRFSRILIILISFLPISARAGPRNDSTHDAQVAFGSQLLHLDDGCASIHGTLTAGDFFADLRRTDKRGQLEYRKQGKIVTQYPRSLTTSIEILGDRCATAMLESHSNIFLGNSYALRLEVYWKRGLQLRPALLSPVPAADCAGYSNVTIGGDGLAVPAIACRLTVDSEGVPLGDHLIVSILDSDGRRLTRISAAP